MNWIKFSNEVIENPKMIKMAAILGIDPVHAAGCMAGVWLKTAVFAPDGDITPFTKEILVSWARWTGDAAAFFDAMMNCGCRGAGFIERTADGRIVMHDWEEHAEFTCEKASRKEYMRSYRERRKDAACDDESSENDASGSSESSVKAARNNSVTSENVTCNNSVTPVTVTCNTIEKNRKEENRAEEKRADSSCAIFAGENAPSCAASREEQDACFEAIVEMYRYLPKYSPRPPEELKFIAEIWREYPRVPVLQELRRAGDWLRTNPPSKRSKKDLVRFLRNWIKRANDDAVALLGAGADTFVPCSGGGNGDAA